MIWRSLLRLPLNRTAFEKLIDKGPHPHFRGAYQEYNRFVRILSAICYWCPFLVEVDYLPAFVFPFVKTNEEDDLILFEVLISLITHWCRGWFRFFPNEPVHFMQIVESLIDREDPALLVHLRKYGFSARSFAWPAMKFNFSELLNKEGFLYLFDNFFFHWDKPALASFFTAAYILTCREELSCVVDESQLAEFLSRENDIDIRSVFDFGLTLFIRYESLLERVDALNVENPTFPLPKSDSEYPPLAGYPSQYRSSKTELFNLQT